MNERQILALILAAQLATLGLVGLVALRPVATPDDVFDATAGIDVSDPNVTFALDGLSSDLQAVKASIDSIEASMEADTASGLEGEISGIRDRLGSIESAVSNLERTMRSICTEVSATPFGC